MHRDINLATYRLHTEEKQSQYTSSNKYPSNKSDSLIHGCNNCIDIVSNDIANAVSSVDGFVTHTGNHTVEKSYQCRHCNKSCNKVFSSKSDLLKHEMTHTSKKPLQCSSCNMIFLIIMIY